MTQTPLKILQVSSESGWRGGEQQIAYLLDETKKAGADVHLACRKATPMADYGRSLGLPVLELAFRNNLDFLSAWRLKKYVTQEGFDLIHVHSSRGHGIVHLASRLGLRTPIVLTRRVAFPIKKKQSTLKRYNHPLVKKIICVSQAVKAATAPALSDPSLLQVVHSGIDLQRFTRNPLPTYPLHTLLRLAADVPVVGTVAALTSEKDLTTFVKAAALIHREIPDIHFVIIGDGPERKMLEDLSRSLNLDNHLHFPGRRQDVPALLPELTVFLFSSAQEGLGTSVLDAFASNVPVVSTNAGGLPEMVKHEQTGLIAPVGKAETLAAHTIRMIRDKEFAQSCAINAYTLVSQHFSKEVMAQETLKVYKALVPNRL